MANGGNYIKLPMDLWFSNNNDENENKRKEIAKKADVLVSRALFEDNIQNDATKLYEIIDSLFDYQDQYVNTFGMFMWPAPTPLKTHTDILNHFIKQYHINSGSKYYDDSTKVVTTTTEVCNGYQLYDFEANFGIRQFETFEKLYNDDTEFTYEEFNEEFDKIACYDWAKQQPDGECFGKYYNGDYDNASELTWQWNCRELYNLPYSKKLVLYTVKFGCPTRLESVRYSNFICEWTKRKIEKLNHQPKDLINVMAIASDI